MTTEDREPHESRGSGLSVRAAVIIAALIVAAGAISAAAFIWAQPSRQSPPAYGSAPAPAIGGGAPPPQASAADPDWTKRSVLMPSAGCVAWRDATRQMAAVPTPRPGWSPDVAADRSAVYAWAAGMQPILATLEAVPASPPSAALHDYVQAQREAISAAIDSLGRDDLVARPSPSTIPAYGGDLQTLVQTRVAALDGMCVG